MYWTNGGGERVWCVGLQVFMLCRVLQDIALVRFWKKLQKFLLKSLEVMKKSLPLQPLSETKRRFWNILTDVFFIFCGWSLQKLSSTAVPKKKFEKKVRKDLEGICKSIYLCIRFRLISGAGKREAKEFLKILKGLKTNSKCESENKFDGYNDWAKEIIFKVFITMKSLILAQDER